MSRLKADFFVLRQGFSPLDPDRQNAIHGKIILFALYLMTTGKEKQAHLQSLFFFI